MCLAYYKTWCDLIVGMKNMGKWAIRYGGYAADIWRTHGGHAADMWRIYGGYMADGRQICGGHAADIRQTCGGYAADMRLLALQT